VVKHESLESFVSLNFLAFIRDLGDILNTTAKERDLIILFL